MAAVDECYSAIEVGSLLGLCVRSAVCWVCASGGQLTNVCMCVRAREYVMRFDTANNVAIVDPVRGFFFVSQWSTYCESVEHVL
jgi:hypothetical protein